MNREEARRLSVENGSNEPPPDDLLEAIKAACERGERHLAVTRWEISKKQEHWLGDAGYTTVSVDGFVACSLSRVVRIEW